ncbi:hypothetical protein ACFFV7_51130 [Nonomuraea spiralis]|uniref:Uncharacterized protein n=1 Tax=Nonomuraea spiralis TaxID=46182 RepID=A0ABV5IYG4_9ACTN|nr:hypothetical protein [Nonomuraea spiralis]GGS88252.1 hypothetical protein GCM10010176_035010 [Nonomuraea spiralis]
MSRDTISVGRVYFGKNPRLHEKTHVYVNGIPVRRIGRRIQLLHEDWPIETARMVAAALLELAEAAEAEPDPELLAALSETIDDAIGGDPGIDTELLARDVLAAFKVEKRGHP